MGSQQDTAIAHLATQLELREQQLPDTTQQLEAARAQVLALRAAAAQRGRRLEESLRQASDTHEQVRRLQRALHSLCGVVPRRADPLPILQHVLRALRHLAPPSSPAPPFPILSLPDTALQLVVHKAGVAIRAVCRHLRDIHAPLAHLHPLALDGMAPAELRAALHRPSLLQHLTHLDLQYASAWANPETLASASLHATGLRKLSTDVGIQMVSTCVAPLAALVGSLRELDLGWLDLWGLDELALFGRLTQLRALRVNLVEQGAGTRAASFTIAPFSSLQRLTRLELQLIMGSRPHVDSADLLPVVTQLPLLRHLKLPEKVEWQAPHVELLASLCRLTALGVGCAYVSAAAAGPALVCAIAGLPDLRELALLDADAWALRHLGPLSRLRLSALAATFIHDFVGAGRLLGGLLSTGGMPALTRLELDGEFVGYSEGEELALLPLLARGLRVLHLTSVLLPEDVFEQLGEFGGLRELSVRHCTTAGMEPIGSLRGLSRLTHLASLGISCYAGQATAEELAHLTALTRLSLQDPDSKLYSEQQLAELLWALLPLQRLQTLCVTAARPGSAAALAPLQLLPALVRCQFRSAWVLADDIRRRRVNVPDAVSEPAAGPAVQPAAPQQPAARRQGPEGSVAVGAAASSGVRGPDSKGEGLALVGEAGY